SERSEMARVLLFDCPCLYEARRYTGTGIEQQFRIIDGAVGGYELQAHAGAGENLFVPLTDTRIRASGWTGRQSEIPTRQRLERSEDRPQRDHDHRDQHDGSDAGAKETPFEPSRHEYAGSMLGHTPATLTADEVSGGERHTKDQDDKDHN